jgi:GINS complex subunit 4
MQGQLSHMDEGLEPLDPSDFRRIVHKMELERIRYLINSYLRYRLQKIENYTKYFLNEEENRQPEDKRASESEMKYAQAYYELMENHFKQLIFRHIPPQQDDVEKRIVRPNLMSNVIIKVNNPCGTLVNSNDEEVDLNEVNTLHMLPYQLISDLLIKGDVDLV